MTGQRRRKRSAILTLAAAMALMGVWPGSAVAKGVSEADLLRKVEKGGTAADHAALAAYYRDQAKMAESKATEHEAMASKYGPVMGKTDWPTHCRSLASYYHKLAEEYAAMATLHEGHAAELRKK